MGIVHEHVADVSTIRMMQMKTTIDVPMSEPERGGGR
jgi:hypothetical protein